MRRRLVDELAAPIYAVVDLAVILAPAVAIWLAANRGGMGDAEGVDLIAASAVLGLVHAGFAWSRLWSEERIAVRRADMWISAVDGLVVLALGATLLLLAVLYRFADEHASMVDRGYPVILLWAGVQLVAVVVAEATARFVFWWLEPHEARARRRVARLSGRPRRRRRARAPA